MKGDGLPRKKNSLGREGVEGGDDEGGSGGADEEVDEWVSTQA